MLKNLLLSFMAVASSVNMNIYKHEARDIYNNNYLEQDSLICVGDYDDINAYKLFSEDFYMSDLLVSLSNNTYYTEYGNIRDYGYSYDIYMEGYGLLSSNGATRYIYSGVGVSYINDYDGLEYDFIDYDFVDHYQDGPLYLIFYKVNNRPIVLSQNLFTFFECGALFDVNDEYIINEEVVIYGTLYPYINIPKDTKSFEIIGRFDLSNNIFEYGYMLQNSNLFTKITYNDFYNSLEFDDYYNSLENITFKRVETKDYYSYILYGYEATNYTDYKDIPIMYFYAPSYNAYIFAKNYLTAEQSRLNGTYYFVYDNYRYDTLPNEFSNNYDINFISNNEFFNYINIQIYKLDNSNRKYNISVFYGNAYRSLLVFDFDVTLGLNNATYEYHKQLEQYRIIELDTLYRENDLNMLLTEYYFIEPTEPINNVPLPENPDNPNVLTDVFDLISSAFLSLTSIFSIAIFPYVTLGALLLVPIVVMIILFVINLFKR
jgi:hypothetical protein